MGVIDPITQALQGAVHRDVFPGVVLLVRVEGSITYHQAIGLASRVPTPTVIHLDTLYDLASLTKPLATGTAILCLVQDGILDLDQSVGCLLEECAGRPIGLASVRDLLCHRSGLPAWRPYYQQISCRNVPQVHPGFEGTPQDYILNCIRQEPLEYRTGTQSLYSDLGFILLGAIVERCTKRSLAQYCHERMYVPLGANPLYFFDQEGNTFFGEGGSFLVAPTEQDPWRGRLLRGEVHDENAYALGGVAGHAGLFGTASAVGVMTGAWLDGYQGRHSFLHRDLVREFVLCQPKVPGSSWGLGWDTPSKPSSSGTRFSSRAFGHLGFTGTSVWIDPACDLEVILLTNRVHLSRQNTKIQEFRPLIHDIVYEGVMGEASP